MEDSRLLMRSSSLWDLLLPGKSKPFEVELELMKKNSWWLKFNGWWSIFVVV
jgi:hypothetical protein